MRTCKIHYLIAPGSTRVSLETSPHGHDGILTSLRQLPWFEISFGMIWLANVWQFCEYYFTMQEGWTNRAVVSRDILNEWEFWSWQLPLRAEKLDGVRLSPLCKNSLLCDEPVATIRGALVQEVFGTFVTTSCFIVVIRHLLVAFWSKILK